MPGATRPSRPVTSGAAQSAFSTASSVASTVAAKSSFSTLGGGTWRTPPAASQVYELTDYGQALKPVIRELAVWGIRSLGPPSLELAPAPHWLENALDTVFAPVAPSGSFEFHVGEDVASIVEGEARPGPLESADVVVGAPDPAAFYHLFVERRWDEIEVEGDRDLLERLLDAASAPAAGPQVPATV